MKKYSLFIIIFISLCIVGTLSRPHTTRASEDCKESTVIFARGSGEELNTGEGLYFFNQLQKRIPSSIAAYYELGTQTYGDTKYEPISVDPYSHVDNAIGAWTTAGYGNDYGESIRAGTIELFNYLVQHEDCDSKIVLAGYSQGAQLIGQSLSYLSERMRDKIVFVALFGDPKLYLPEGEGFNPPALSQ